MPKEKCIVEIDGIQVEKNVGDTWNNTIENCIKHICEIDDHGETTERTFREYCYISCHNVNIN